MTAEISPVAVLAESNEETRFLIRALLEFLGFIVIETGDGDGAYEAAVCYRPNLILIELTLPLVSGFSAIRRIRKQSELTQIPIIAMSSAHRSVNGRLALAAGCTAYLQEPIEFENLERIVTQLIPCKRLEQLSLMIN